MSPKVKARIEAAIHQRSPALDLSKCELTSIPVEVGEMTWLTGLSLFSNKIMEIKGLDQLTQLTELNLHSNQITEIKGLEQLTKLTWLNLSSNQITEIKGLEQLTQLTELNLHSNQITEIKGLEQLTKLTSLYLSSNQITEIKGLEKLTQLTTLDLSSNQITEIKGLEQLTQLTTLYLHSNEITEIKGLEQLTQLTQLSFFSNKITEIKGLEKLTQLTTLYLDSNQITEIKGLEKLTQLTTLYLDSNQITEIKGLEKLTQLTMLHLGYNEITEIKGLEKLTQLTQLSFSSNKITEIKGLEKLTQLTTLYLDSNQFEDIYLLQSFIIGEIPIKLEEDHEKGLYLYDNPITNPPLEILQQGNEAVLAYWEQLERAAPAELTPLNEARILIVGDGESGKTTLQRKLLNANAELPEPDDRTRKIVKQVLPYQLLDGIDFKLHLWDFGGQNIQYFAHQFFLSSDVVYVLVTDGRRQSSNFIYWLHIINLLGKDSPIFLLQNQKQDAAVASHYSVDLQQHFPVLQKERAINLKQVYQLGHLPEGVTATPAIEQHSNNLQIFLADLAAAAQALPINTVPRTPSFRKVRSIVIEERKNGPYCRLKNLLSIKDAPDKEQFISDLITLNIVGECVYHPKDALLKNFVFLDPQWIIDAMYLLVENPKLQAKRGEFSEQDADRIWADTDYEDMTLHLLRLLKHFYLCYQVPGTTTYIAPKLLPAAEAVPWDEEGCFRLFFKYTFMPHGILTRIICRLYDWIPGEQVWNDAVVLEMPDAPENQAFLRESYDQQQILLDVKGPESIEMIERIRKVITDIHQEAHYANLRYKEVVPCPCPDCKNSPQPEEYRFSSLLRKIQNGNRFVECQLDDKKVPIAEFKLRIRSKSAYILAHPADKQHEEALVKHLGAYLRDGRLDLSRAKDVLPGDNKNEFITNKLSFADVVFILLSPNLNTDTALVNRVEQIIEQSARHAKQIIPVKLSAAVYHDFIKVLESLPRGSTIDKAENMDETWMEIARETGNLLFPEAYSRR